MAICNYAPFIDDELRIKKEKNRLSMKITIQNYYMKMMIRTLSFLIFILMSISAIGQANKNHNAVGEYISMGEQIIPGYYDKHTPVGFSLNLYKTELMRKHYSPGFYYDNNGEKHQGYIKLADSTYYFKHDQEGEVKLLSAKECSALVMGVDSFAIVNNFNVEYKLHHFKSERKEFARVIYERNDTIVYEHKRAGLKDHVWTILYKLPDSDCIHSFSKKDSKFRQKALAFFADWDYMTQALNDNRFEPFYCREMIELYKYHKLFKNGGKIYFSSTWEETNNPKCYTYYGTVTHEDGRRFSVSYYYLDGTPVYSGTYSSLYHKKMDGRFEWYFQDGSVRKSAQYTNGELNGMISFYYPDGRKHYEVRPLSEPFFNKIWNEQGENILKGGKAKESFFDPILNRTIHREYKGRKLLSSYAEKDGEIIYQLCDKNSNFLQNTNYIERKVVKDLVILPQDFSEMNEGVLLVKVIIGVDGYITEVEIIKGITPFVDSQVITLFENIKEKKFGAAKHDKKKVKQEIIIPIELGLINPFGYSPREKEKIEPPGFMSGLPAVTPGL